ncbi:MAG: hypothetical protein ACUVV0_14335 [Anaerolineae bacterium]
MNPEKESAEFSLIQQLMSNMKCVVCQNHYEPDDVHFLDHRDEVWVLEVTCSNCGTKGLVFAMLKEAEGGFTAGELTPEEWSRFQKMPAVDTDEVLELRRFLRDFEGDFSDLFSKQRG